MIQAMKSQNLQQKSGVIDSQTTKGKYKQSDTIKFETETIKSSLFDYSDAFILVYYRKYYSSSRQWYRCCV